MQLYLETEARPGDGSDIKALAAFAATFARRWPTYRGRLVCARKPRRGDGADPTDANTYACRWKLVDSFEWYHRFGERDENNVMFWIEGGRQRRIGASFVRPDELAPGLAGARRLATTRACDYMRVLLRDTSPQPWSWSSLGSCGGTCDIFGAYGSVGPAAAAPDPRRRRRNSAVCHHHGAQLRRFLCDGPFLMVATNYEPSSVYQASLVERAPPDDDDDARVARLLHLDKLPPGCYASGRLVTASSSATLADRSPEIVPSHLLSARASADLRSDAKDEKTQKEGESVKRSDRAPDGASETETETETKTERENWGARDTPAYPVVCALAKLFVWCDCWLHNMRFDGAPASDEPLLRALAASRRAEDRFLLFLRLSGSSQESWLEWYCGEILGLIERCEAGSADRSKPAAAPLRTLIGSVSS